MKALLVAALLVALAAPARAQSLNTPEDVLDYLAGHRKDVALVSFSVGPDGSPDPADPVLSVNADQPMVLASTIKIVVLAAYAREVAAGRLDPDVRQPHADLRAPAFPGRDRAEPLLRRGGGGAVAPALAGGTE